ncbi:uncharacterized protein ppp1r32 [Hippoglossus stenolepis]|uniref:uncharacterized protein ppp1r32 n=1 Tax=Hippoglossus stenolepis TaxID=195615 RepID=UPI00159CA97A|nr:uncharacterized protein ppp1r32 [Hippoglossus stenolepis]
MSYLRPPSETGFTANQRPVVVYRPILDHTENVVFGHRLLLSNNFLTLTKLHYQPHIRTDCSGPLPNLINEPRDSGFHQLRSHLQPETVSQKPVTIGPKGETGFTEGTNLQFITFQEKNNSRVEPQQTHSSVMKHDFLLPSLLQLDEPTGSLLNSSNQVFPNTPFDGLHFTTHYRSELFATHSFGMRARKEKEEEGFIHYSSIHSSIQNKY